MNIFSHHQVTEPAEAIGMSSLAPFDEGPPCFGLCVEGFMVMAISYDWLFLWDLLFRAITLKVTGWCPEHFAKLPKKHAISGNDLLKVLPTI